MSKLPEGVDLLPSGKYRWRVDVGYRQGKRIRATGIADTPKKAKLARAQAVTDHERRVMAVPNKITLEQYALQWLKTQDVRGNTKRLYLSELQYAFEVLGDMPIKDIQATDIKKMLLTLKARVMGAKEGKGKGNGATMSTRTLGMVRTRLKSVFASAVVDRIIYINPVESVKRVKGNHEDDSRQGVALDFPESARLQELGELLHEAGLCRLWVALFTAVSVGLRRGEVMGLRLQDVDLKRNVLMVRKNLILLGGELHLDQPKTAGSVRDIPIPPSLNVWLEQQVKAMHHEASIRGEKLNPESPLFATVTGAFTAPDNLNRALQNLLEWSNPDPKPRTPRDTKGVKPRAFNVQRTTLERRFKSVPVQHRARLEAIIKSGQALPAISPHDLRHTAGTQMLRRGMLIEVVSKILGHATVSITMDIYRHVNQAEIAASIVDLYPIKPARAVLTPPLN